MSAEKGGGLARSTANVGFQSVWLDPTVLKFACTGMGAGATIPSSRPAAWLFGTFLFFNPISRPPTHGYEPTRSNAGGERSGAGGAKGGDQGKCGPAQHVPGAEPGKRGTVAGAHTASSLRSMPARYLFLDEVDAYPPWADDKGDTSRARRSALAPHSPGLRRSGRRRSFVKPGLGMRTRLSLLVRLSQILPARGTCGYSPCRQGCRGSARTHGSTSRGSRRGR